MLSQRLYTTRYHVLLASLTGLSFLAPLIDHSVISRVVVAILLMASLLTATQAVRTGIKLDVKLASLAVFAAVSWIMAFMVDSTPFNTSHFQLMSHAAVFIFFSTIGSIILKDVLSGNVNANRICGSVCVFLLIGFCFSMIHMMINISHPASYRDNSLQYDLSRDHHEHYPLFSYFSFCTLSTVGYGDIVPVSKVARSVSCLEALCGQLYLAILIARLVGLHIAKESSSSGSANGTPLAVPRIEREDECSEERELAGSIRR